MEESTRSGSQESMTITDILLSQDTEANILERIKGELQNPPGDDRQLQLWLRLAQELMTKDTDGSYKVHIDKLIIKIRRIQEESPAEDQPLWTIMLEHVTECENLRKLDELCNTYKAYLEEINSQTLSESHIVKEKLKVLGNISSVLGIDGFTAKERLEGAMRAFNKGRASLERGSNIGTAMFVTSLLFLGRFLFIIVPKLMPISAIPLLQYNTTTRQSSTDLFRDIKRKAVSTDVSVEDLTGLCQQYLSVLEAALKEGEANPLIDKRIIKAKSDVVKNMLDALGGESSDEGSKISRFREIFNSNIGVLKQHPDNIGNLFVRAINFISELGSIILGKQVQQEKAFLTEMSSLDPALQAKQS